MSVVSKLLDKGINKYEELGYSKLTLSKGIVTTAVLTYVIQLAYPHLKKRIKEFNKNNSDSDNNVSDINNLNNSDNTINNNNNDNYRNNNINNNSNGKNIKKKLKNTRKSLSPCQNDENIGLQNNNSNSSNDRKKQFKKTSSIDEIVLGNKSSIALVDVKEKVKEAEKLLAESTTKNAKSKQKIGLNLNFLIQLKNLIEIMIPNIFSYEIGLLSVHTLCLISRTFLSIIVAGMEGAIVKYIVQKDIKRFSLMLLKWFGIAIPATFINSMIRFLENKLALAFRTRLVNHSYKLYFKNQTYYRVSNLDGRIENADHRLTEDITVFTSSIAHLYSHLTKPCFDLMLIALALMRSSKKMKANFISGPLLAFIVISTTAHILRVLSPKFGQLVSEEANRYGYLRHVHSRVITNAEEIAFYGGHKVELLQLREAYSRLTDQMNKIFSQKLWFVMLEQFFMKYVWSGTGMIMISLPILTASSSSSSSSSSTISSTCETDCTNVTTSNPLRLEINNRNVSERTQYLTTARNLLISGADAVERLMSSYKEIVTLAGYTYRVAEMIKVFEETSNGVYNKGTTIQNDTERNNAGILNFSANGQPIANGKIIYLDNPTEDCTISLINVPIVTPNCDIVVASLTLRIEPGMHLLITGPNGCGKSSLFRILSGLWPIYGGELYMPKSIADKPCMMFYIPQRPYLSIGSLRDQIIYPDTVEDMLRKNISVETLKNILKMVSLEHIAARDNFDLVRDWKDILSGGEKQRMAIARLFYHKPKYALLDECTSAVSIDVENSIYRTAKELGITLMTITHRPTLWKFHTHILAFDGQGGWQFNELGKDDQQIVPPLEEQ